MDTRIASEPIRRRSEMDLGLTGRVAIVTGGSHGIGRATAEQFAREGARVAITYRRHKEEAETLVDSLRSAGTDACASFLDLAEAASIREAVATTQERWGRIDALVNNAVEWQQGPVLATVPFEDLPSAEWERLIRTNIEGVYSAMQAVLPAMKARGWGRIVTVSSVWAEEGMPGFAWSATAKSALHGLNHTIAKEAGPAGILANIVAPGLTATEGVHANFPGDALKRQARGVCIRRLPRPDEVASVIVFLCSAENRVITGEVVRPTGGR
jgi:NAD(P)-dependent dehydrogenase (short-subunit alcohol dehydrogenase family)